VIDNNDNDDDDDNNADSCLFTTKFKTLMANYMDGRSTKRQKSKSKQEQTSQNVKKIKKTWQLFKSIEEINKKRFGPYTL
jgi:hypothetical protein